MSIVLFSNRTDAGRQLAAQLKHLAGREHLVVLGLPRGGVPVAFEVARALGAPMDVFLVRKLGVPGQEELAMGAVATGGVRVLNDDTVASLGIPSQVVDQVTESELRELARRDQLYRGARPMPDLAGATVVLVDDGVATGATMLAAVQALRQHHPGAVIVAAPVMSGSAHSALSAAADGCVAVAVREPFYGVGVWYEDFRQTSDREVLTLLERAGVLPPASPYAPAS
jgi:predicted phosphoribosyltransferase